MPGLHIEHILDDTAEYEPPIQLKQVLLKGTENFPAIHVLVTEERPEVAQMKPAGHGWHAIDALCANDPTGHTPETAVKLSEPQ